MLNGIYTKDELRVLEKDLLSIDNDLGNFAISNHFKLTKNYHNHPERSLELSNDLDRLIQIYPIEDGKNSYKIWLCASKDLHGYRYIKKYFYKENISINEIEANLENILDECRHILLSWKFDDLEKSVKLEVCPEFLKDIK